MKYGNVGSSTLRVSKLSLGTMTFGTGPGFAGLRPKVDDRLAARLVATAVERGVTLFDSAGRYQDGQAEIILGRAVAPYRDRVMISTKDPVLPASEAGPVAEQIAASVEASLARLGVETINLYQVGVSRLDQGVEDLAAGLDAVVRRGLVHAVGVTNLPSWLLERAAATAVRGGCSPIVAAQMSYSLLERGIEIDYSQLLADRGIGVLAWSPLAGGFLTGKYTRENPDGGGGRLSTFRLQPIDRERGFEIVEVLRTIASSRQVPPAAVALAWVADRDIVSSAVFGATSLEGLEANLAAADLTLTREETRSLDEASSTSPPYPYWLYPPLGR
jgi:aryl-alcohol dehydrogenase-like predicted oxidoreductase